MATCNVCVKAITKSQLKLSCVDCGLFFHGVCVKMSKTDIEMLNDKGFAWRCDPCSSSRRRSMRLETQAETGKLTLEDIMAAISEMKDEQKQIAAGFNTSYEALNSKLDESMETIKQQTTEMKAYLEKMERLEAENKSLKSKLSVLETKLEDMDQYSRRNCIEIHGVPEASDPRTEDVIGIVQNVGTALGMEIDGTMIDACHRLGKPNDAARRGPRGVIVKFVRRIDMEELMEKKRKKRLSTRHMNMQSDVPVYVNESLSPSRRRLFALARQAKRDKGYKHVWHRGGKVFMRKTDNDVAIVISHQADLSNL